MFGAIFDEFCGIISLSNIITKKNLKKKCTKNKIALHLSYILQLKLFQEQNQERVF